MIHFPSALVAKAASLCAAGALLAAVPAVSLAADDSAARSKAPNFRATDVEGRKVSLGDLLEKGPVVLDFWATWCKPCLKEMPYLQRLHERYADKGLQVVGVSIDSPKSQAQVKKVAASRGFTFLILLDGDQEILRKMQGKGSVPYVVLIDRDGSVRYQHTGYRPGDEKVLEQHVLPLLGVESVPATGAEG